MVIFFCSTQITRLGLLGPVTRTLEGGAPVEPLRYETTRGYVLFSEVWVIFIMRVRNYAGLPTWA